ncbi:hypothetical protein DL239_02545 [Sedimentitalea sp. CY04]|uniref:Uncharacterized protein n=1 Tax=Parasedimentitalea denitrificans TaxID=2211118 RepID=A0ABX0W6P2_9RHOB|nr:hypothetical protein [Sedimentitalea sp. CY04]NIZ59851.1 hypothetical protein [Sedimentitalea sp. CY04]
MSRIHPKAAVITLHPYLPSEDDQLAGARDWGLPGLEEKPQISRDIFRDDVRKIRTTNWPSKLPNRDVLLRVYRDSKVSEDEVFFANPLCVGFSQKHAQSTIEDIHRGEALLYVHDMRREFRPGDDLAPLWKEHLRQLKNAQMRQYRT